MARVRKGCLIKRGRTYYACWFIGGRKFVRTTGKTIHREALQELAKIMEPFLIEDEVKTLQNIKTRIESNRADLATLHDQRTPPLTIAKVWAAYTASAHRPDSGPKTLETYQLQWGRFLSWLHDKHPGVLAMRDVTPAIAGNFVAHLLAEKRSAGTVNKYVTLLRCMYRVLRDKAHLEHNPFEGITRRKDIKQGRRELTVDELQRVCRSAKDDLRILFAIGLYTGLRLADAATLLWGEVDLVRGIIRRIPSKTARRNPTPVLIPIHPVLRQMLGEIAANKRQGPVLPRISADYLRHPTYVTDRIQKHFADCDIQTQRHVASRKLAVVEVGFHSMRHSFVSLCREANAPLAVVEAIVGHSNPAMTRHYTHVSELAAGRAVAALPAVLGPASPLPPPAPNTLDVEKIRALIARLTPKNALVLKVEMQKLLPPSGG
jgi:integrase